jgi:hypothetical protein
VDVLLVDALNGVALMMFLMSSFIVVNDCVVGSLLGLCSSSCVGVVVVQSML